MSLSFEELQYSYSYGCMSLCIWIGGVIQRMTSEIVTALALAIEK